MTDQLRQAAQQALVALECMIDDLMYKDHKRVIDISNVAITALRTALEQQAEPVAWMFQHDETGRMNYVSNDGIHTPTMFLEMNPRYALVCPLYTTSPKRPWVGLTEEEKKHLATAAGCTEDDDGHIVTEIFKLAEAKLKERNT